MLFSLVARGAERPMDFSTGHYIAWPALLISDVLLFSHPPPNPPNWKGGILFDDIVRDALRIKERGPRESVAMASDILVFSLVAYPFVVDAIADKWIGQHDGESAQRLALISSEALLGMTLLRLITKVTVGRERPLARECGADPNYDPDCGKDSSFTSFFSGHASTAFTAAGLVCAAHESLNLAGGSVPCYVALGAATSVAMMRVIADKHYMTDVIVGAGIGIASGYFLPKLLHFESGDKTQSAMAYPLSRGGPGLTFSMMW